MAGQHILFLSPTRSAADVLNRKVFTPAGYDLVYCASVAEAESSLRAAPPEAILVSETIREAPPLEIVRALSLEFPQVPVILFAPEQRDLKMVRQAILMGAADCMVAPLQFEDLVRAVEASIANRKSLLEAAQSSLRTAQGDLKRKVQDVERVSAIGRAITAALDLDVVLTSVVMTAVQMTGAEEGSLLLLDEASGDLYMRAAYNFNDEFVRKFRLPTADTLAGQVVRTGKPVVFGKETPEKIKTAYLVHALIYVPMVLQGRVMGVLGVDNRNVAAHFHENHLEQMAALADYAAIALENARLYSQLEVERGELEAILTRVADGVIVVNPRNELIFANRTAREIFQITQGNYTGKPVRSLVDQEALLVSIENSLTQKNVPRRLEFMSQTGGYFVAQFSFVQNMGLLVTMQDVTHFKELDRIKSDFVHTVSHDLRSPLTAILGYVELIGRAGSINDQQREYIRRVQTSVHSITGLINDLLDLGRIESGVDMQHVVVPIQMVVQLAIEGLQPLISEKKHEIDTQFPPELPKIKGDPTRLRQMVNNLLENAIKYTPEGGKICIRGREEDGLVIMRFEDNGMGVPQMDQPYIFNKLYRGSNIPANVSGSGLGLAIVKSIVESHDGRYWYEPSASGGSVFTVVLPSEKPTL